MATETVPDARTRSRNVTKSTTWRCDVFTGEAEAIIAAGIITAEHLKPQPGRANGYTVFLPDGSPCPQLRRAWREPGYMAIRRLDSSGLYSVEITVSREMQDWRRKAQAAAAREQEQERIEKEVAESVHKYRSWTFRQDFGKQCEQWEGTKAQFQAAGLGVGLKFPGEPGAAATVRCKCPLGFEFEIELPQYDHAKCAARIYTARSWYGPSRQLRSKQFEAFAPGVLREVWTPDCYGGSADTYVGSAEALVAACLVPDMCYFPGQPGRNKGRASYRADWTPSTNANGQTWAATIRKLGNSGRFSVEIPVDKQESERRMALSAAWDAEREQEEPRLSEERKQLRQYAAAAAKDPSDFRAERAEEVELWAGLLWDRVFAKTDGVLSFNLREGTELWDDLAGAFQTIRDAVQRADIVKDKKLEALARIRLGLVAARNDKGLQSLLHQAKHLRLVHSSDDEPRPGA